MGTGGGTAGRTGDTRPGCCSLNTGTLARGCVRGPPWLRESLGSPTLGPPRETNMNRSIGVFAQKPLSACSLYFSFWPPTAYDLGSPPQVTCPCPLLPMSSVCWQLDGRARPDMTEEGSLGILAAVTADKVTRTGVREDGWPAPSSGCPSAPFH